MKTTYKSIPVIASVIGSVTRKAMYITHITSLDGEKIYNDTWIPVSWNQSRPAIKQYVQWEHHSQSLVQFPMAKATPSMIINPDHIVRRLVDNQPKGYIELTERYILHLPVWFFTSKTVVDADGNESKTEPIMTVKYTKPAIVEDELFNNDDDFYGVVESQDASLLEGLHTYQEDRARSTFDIHFSNEAMPQLKQWELDNPEYMSYE